MVEQEENKEPVPIEQKIKNKKPPKRLNFRSESRDPISTGSYVPPNSSIDLQGIENAMAGEIDYNTNFEQEIGETPLDEEAEIRRMVESGEIVLTPFRGSN